MTGDMPESGAAPAMPDVMLDVISTFLDGERVEPGDLKRALESTEGRDYLVDLLTLREAIGGLGPFAAVPRKPAPVWTLLRGSAAAAILILALAGGYIAGHRGSAPADPANGTSESQVLAITSAPSAPKPTQVIKLEPGVNWSDSNGGK
jgi:hypothetical protein